MTPLYRKIGYALAAALATAAVVFSLSTRPPDKNTPIHVVNVFFDGANHDDGRQVCDVWRLGIRHKDLCELDVAYRVGQSAMLGQIRGYKVVPHSQVTWKQDYRGRTVELGLVYGTYGKSIHLVAHLLKVNGKWYVVRIESSE